MLKSKFIILLLSSMMFSSLTSSAQDRIISGEVFYANFLGYNRSVFKPTIGFNLEYKRKLVFGVGIMKFKPKSDIFYLEDGGTVSYKDYLVIPIYVGKDFDINIGSQFKISPGVQFGYTLVSYEEDISGTDQMSGNTYDGGKIGLASRLKFTYETEKKIVLYFDARYNGMFEITGLNDDGSQSVGAYHHYVTFGLGIGLNLE